MTKLYRSLIFCVSERSFSSLLFVLSTAILSRLLAPAEFGVYAVLTAMTTVASGAFQEFGGANYLIQKEELTRGNIRTGFTITLCLSLLLALVLLAGRGVLSSFFSKPELAQGINIVAAEVLLAPFCITVSALLRRELNFRHLALSTFAANLAAAVSTVVLAALHFGFMAPVWGSLVASSVLCAMLLGSRRDFSIFRPSLKEGGGVLSFGAYSSAVVLINIAYQSAPQLILGRVLDFRAVGLFGRAVSVTQVFDRLVLQAVQPVVMPAIFTQTRAGGDLRGIYLRSVTLITAVQWPFLLLLALLAEPLVTLWLGPAWTPIVPLVRCLCVASLAMFGACLTYPVLVACGRVKDTLISSLISLPPALLITLLVAPYGLQATAASTLLTLPFQAAVAMLFIARQLGFGARDLARSVGKSAAVAAASCVGPALFLSLRHLGLGSEAPAWVQLSEAGATGVAGWGLALWLTSHPLLDHVRAAAVEAFSLLRPRSPPPCPMPRAGAAQ